MGNWSERKDRLMRKGSERNLDLRQKLAAYVLHCIVVPGLEEVAEGQPQGHTRRKPGKVAAHVEL